MSRNLRVLGILAATVIALTGYSAHAAERPSVQHVTTTQAADDGDSLIWD
jgi:hypothetical protein